MQVSEHSAIKINVLRSDGILGTPRTVHYTYVQKKPLRKFHGIIRNEFETYLESFICDQGGIQWLCSSKDKKNCMSRRLSVNVDSEVEIEYFACWETVSFALLVWGWLHAVIDWWNDYCGNCCSAERCYTQKTEHTGSFGRVTLLADTSIKNDETVRCKIK